MGKILLLEPAGEAPYTDHLRFLKLRNIFKNREKYISVGELTL